jgi:hypothetical protein
MRWDHASQRCGIRCGSHLVRMLLERNVACARNQPGVLLVVYSISMSSSWHSLLAKELARGTRACLLCGQMGESSAQY